MSDKVNGGDPLKISARVWNGFVEASDAHRQRAKMGLPGGRVRTFAPECSIKIQNDSGGDLEAGSVLAINSTLLTAPDKRHLWFSGDAPTAGQCYAVLTEAIPYGSIGAAQVGGICLASVDIGDADHEWAHVDAGSTTLVSDFGGTAKILWKPSGTGVKECLVELGITSGPRRAMADVDIGAGSAGAVSVHTSSDIGTIDTAYNDWADSAAIAAADEIVVEWFDQDEKWRIRPPSRSSEFRRYWCYFTDGRTSYLAGLSVSSGTYDNVTLDTSQTSLSDGDPMGPAGENQSDQLNIIRAGTYLVTGAVNITMQTVSDGSGGYVVRDIAATASITSTGGAIGPSGHGYATSSGVTRTITIPISGEIVINSAPDGLIFTVDWAAGADPSDSAVIWGAHLHLELITTADYYDDEAGSWNPPTG